jgi:dipeptidyl aminopeptidase/acylaminoacyl peptidase
MRATLCFIVTLMLAGAPAIAQGPDPEPVYQTPNQVLVDIVDAPPTPSVSLGPDNEWMLLQELPSLPAIDELAERELRLAGIRIKPRINGRSRGGYYTGLRLMRVADGAERAITGLPSRPRIGNVRWAPDGRSIAFTNTTANGIELWVADVASGAARRLVGARLNLTLSGGPVWRPDGRSIFVTLVPEGRGAEPAAPQVPSGPVIEENIGKTAPARTYQDLLENAHDERMFEHYATSRLVRVSLDGTETPIGTPGLVADVGPSPDGRFLLVETVHRPFSYLVPVYRFPTRIEVVDQTGRQVYQVADLPLREGVPVAFGSTYEGPRSVQWRADAPATLVWVEALDGGDGSVQASERDRVFMLAAPFTGTPTTLITLGYRYGGIQWGNDELALVYEGWQRTRQQRQWRIQPGEPGAPPELIRERSYEDRYGDPGNPDMRVNTAGRYVLATSQDAGSLFLIGQGASPQGSRPFVDRFDLRTKQTTRLFRSEAPYYERPVQVLDREGRRVLTLRESVSEAANFFVRDVRSGQLRQLTEFSNPTPQLAGYQKQLITYDRADGVKLSGTLYLPPGYEQSDGPLPTLLWAYPREFKSADAAGQITDSPYRFDRLSGWSTVIWLALGYAVLDGPTMPVIGEGDEQPNDTYVDQLVSSAQAAVDEVVRRGVTDRRRVGVGGHSYGAFMTANLLAHSDIFAAGIARSGAYNRTLTPFGFQAEERTYWDAPEVYYTMSPFMHADDIDEPMLMIHGMADNNSGTFPIQSERMYHALKGLGKTTRLVLLPHESHGYRARESVLHMLYEMERWLDTFVKNRDAVEVSDGT